MATIDELMEGKRPGEIRITRATNIRTEYVRPFYKDNSWQWHGLDEHNVNADLYFDKDDWRLYEEPKPKVRRWLWAIKHISYGWTQDLNNRFMTDNEAWDRFVGMKGVKFFKKLPWSEMEFEE